MPGWKAQTVDWPFFFNKYIFLERWAREEYTMDTKKNHNHFTSYSYNIWDSAWLGSPQ